MAERTLVKYETYDCLAQAQGLAQGFGPARSWPQQWERIHQAAGGFMGTAKAAVVRDRPQ